jgi:hypothetical protein
MVALSDPGAIEAADHVHADRVVTLGLDPVAAALRRSGKSGVDDAGAHADLR